MAAKQIGFSEREKVSLDKALGKAAWETKVISQHLFDLADLNGKFPDEHGQRVLKALRIVYGLNVDTLGVGGSGLKVQRIAQTLEDPATSQLFCMSGKLKADDYSLRSQPCWFCRDIEMRAL